MEAIAEAKRHRRSYLLTTSNPNDIVPLPSQAATHRQDLQQLQQPGGLGTLNLGLPAIFWPQAKGPFFAQNGMATDLTEDLGTLPRHSSAATGNELWRSLYEFLDDPEATANGSCRAY
ncbi:hypothetical protein HPB49_003816 [Dermacentor silvarum]|uniref:Uncharacterized protein n=1 Tax=Dermacentor silvarum TaxID=543639 RepID=A0ACB8DN76_DERSI|nr:hypothetical protein HPB49_003816 [Dermacentor silvarum]